VSALLDVILPVFIVIGFGYVASRWLGFKEAAVDGVMQFAQGFALPLLLFASIARLDMGRAYDAGLMLSFYIGAFSGFAAGFLAGRYLFKRPVTDSIAFGFAGYSRTPCSLACRSPNGPMGLGRWRGTSRSSRSMRRCSTLSGSR
jgi:malonate transporter and related proteins